MKNVTKGVHPTSAKTMKAVAGHKMPPKSNAPARKTGKAVTKTTGTSGTTKGYGGDQENPGM